MLASFEIINPVSELDLYARHALPLPGSTMFDYEASYQGTNDEAIVVATNSFNLLGAPITTNSAPVPLTPGTWYLAVYNPNPNATVVYEVVATYITNGAITITPLTNSATDSQSGATLTWSATGLPAGLAINSSTGTITGTPTTAGSNSVTVKATDGSGYSGTASFTWTITNNVSLANPGNQTNVSGSAVSPVTLVATDSSPGATLTYSATGLPTGLSVNASSGVISPAARDCS